MMTIGEIVWFEDVVHGELRYTPGQVEKVLVESDIPRYTVRRATGVIEYRVHDNQIVKLDETWTLGELRSIEVALAEFRRRKMTVETKLVALESWSDWLVMHKEQAP